MRNVPIFYSPFSVSLGEQLARDGEHAGVGRQHEVGCRGERDIAVRARHPPLDDVRPRMLVESRENFLGELYENRTSRGERIDFLWFDSKITNGIGRDIGFHGTGSCKAI